MKTLNLTDRQYGILLETLQRFQKDFDGLVDEEEGMFIGPDPEPAVFSEEFDEFVEFIENVE